MNLNLGVRVWMCSMGVRGYGREKFGQGKSIHIRSTQSDVIVTEKLWLYQLQRISRKRASSVNLYISARKKIG